MARHDSNEQSKVIRQNGDHPHPPPMTHRWTRALAALCLLQFIVLLALSVVYRDVFFSGHARVARWGEAHAGQDPLFYGRPGPWGDLKYVRMTIEPPDEFVPADDHAFPPPRWLFGGYQREQLTALFESAGLTSGQRAELLNTNQWTETADGIVVTPSDQVILGLSPAARGRIYSVLAEQETNDFQSWPFTFRPGGFDAWFEHSGLDEATLELVRRLTYTRDQSLCFSDLPQIFPRMAGIPERRRLWKTLSRNATLLMKLQVHPNSDLDALTSYWGKGGRAKDIRPLLDSLAKVPGGMTIDTAQLLPPFARKRLNSYPFPPLDLPGPAPDCYWTAFNFFNEPPDNRLIDPAVWLETLRTNYTAVTSPTYGDLVFLLRTNETPVHAAVYIADDVVFTKNGGNYRQPWILMEWTDVVARYPQNQSLRTAIFRVNQWLE